METLGQRIQRLRKRKDFTQAKFAEACGWESISRVGNYERDAREPSLDDLRKIARVLGVSLMDVIGEDNPQPLNTLDHLSVVEAEAELTGYPDLREPGEPPQTYPLPRQWLDAGSYDPKFLRLIYAPDQGMEPTIQPGDACILDIRRVPPVDQGVG